MLRNTTHHPDTATAITVYFIYSVFSITIPAARAALQPVYNAERYHYQIVSSICFGIFLFGYIAAGTIMFRYFLKISVNETVFQQTRARIEDVTRSKIMHVLHESTYILPFAVFLIGANVLHLILVRARVVCSIVEIIGYGSVLTCVLVMNLRSPNKRWRNIGSAFTILCVIFYWLRFAIY